MWRRRSSGRRARRRNSAPGSTRAAPRRRRRPFPNGCHAGELETDPETGEILVDRYAVVDDVGRVINPMICHGQIEGALAQGIGQALMESVAFDRESGQLLSASFMDYAMPRASDLPPHYQLDFIDVPAKTNPIGVKGVGEAGCVGAPPAVMNAVLDALRPLGVQHLDMPAKTTPIGVKGVAEAGCVAAPPALMNAVLDALRPLGVKHLDMPATPHRVWQ